MVLGCSGYSSILNSHGDEIGAPPHTHNLEDHSMCKLSVWDKRSEDILKINSSPRPYNQNTENMKDTFIGVWV